MRALLLFLALTGTAAAAPTAQQLAAAVKSHYAGIAHMKATFTQEETNATFGKTTTTKGTVRVAKLGRMRMDYDSKKTFVIDGKRLWIVDVANKQLTEKNLRSTSLPAAVTFLYGGGNLANQYTLALASNGTLELTPKHASTAYAKINLTVDNSGEVSESLVTDAAGNTSRYIFTNVDTTTAIRNSLFVVRRKALPKYRYVYVP